MKGPCSKALALRWSRAIFFMKLCLGLSKNVSEFQFFQKILEILLRKKRVKVELENFCAVFRVECASL